MKMKDQLDSAQPMKKHKAKTKKSTHKKKKPNKADAKKAIKEKKSDASTKTDNIKATDAQANTYQQAPVPLPVLNNTLNAQVSEDDQATTSRQRASKSLSPMSKEEQLIAINHIIKRLLLDEVTQGEALRELRVGVLGIRQDAYTKLCGVSRKTLSEIENDKGNYTKSDRCT